MSALNAVLLITDSRPILHATSKGLIVTKLNNLCNFFQFHLDKIFH